ncbi:MAG: DUF397 domain-containing protein [Sciscionella sp.]
MTPANARPAWRTSSYSNGANNNCVEVRLHAEAADVRDSKSRVTGSIHYSRPQWAAFLSQLRSA